MKKIIAFTIISSFFLFHSFSEIINWKGMELGIAPNPKWLKSYITKNDEKLLRKKFNITSNEKIIVSSASAKSLETARAGSQIEAQAQVSKLTEKVRLEFIYEYWLEDSEKGFTVYSIYSF